MALLTQTLSYDSGYFLVLNLAAAGYAGRQANQPRV